MVIFRQPVALYHQTPSILITKTARPAATHRKTSTIYLLKKSVRDGAKMCTKCTEKGEKYTERDANYRLGDKSTPVASCSSIEGNRDTHEPAFCCCPTP